MFNFGKQTCLKHIGTDSRLAHESIEIESKRTQIDWTRYFIIIVFDFVGVVLPFFLSFGLSTLNSAMWSMYVCDR